MSYHVSPANQGQDKMCKISWNWLSVVWVCSGYWWSIYLFLHL